MTGDALASPASGATCREIAVTTTSGPDHVDNALTLAVERTCLAHERTLIAWLRTALSMISFGFTFYKFFQAENRPAAARQLIGPREFALFMIGTGLVALALSTLQHRQSMKRLRAESGAVNAPMSIATVVAVAVSVLGLATFIAVLFRA